MENPYASSPSPFSDFSDTPQMPTPGQYARGLVGHVRVLGILMIVQGVLAFGMGAMFVLFIGLMPAIIAANPQANNEAFPTGMLIYYGVAGGVTLVLGLLYIWSGIQVFRFRQRVLGIISLSVGLGTVLTCYCVLTAVGLLIYGLIVLLDGSVRQAFEFSRQGYRPEQIDALFNPWAAPGKTPYPPPT